MKCKVAETQGAFTVRVTRVNDVFDVMTAISQSPGSPKLVRRGSVRDDKANPGRVRYKIARVIEKMFAELSVQVMSELSSLDRLASETGNDIAVQRVD